MSLKIFCTSISRNRWFRSELIDIHISKFNHWTTEDENVHVNNLSNITIHTNIFFLHCAKFTHAINKYFPQYFKDSSC